MKIVLDDNTSITGFSYSTLCTNTTDVTATVDPPDYGHHLIASASSTMQVFPKTLNLAQPNHPPMFGPGGSPRTKLQPHGPRVR